MKAAGAVVAHVFGPVEFGSGDDFERNRLLAGKSDSIVEVSASQAGRIRDHGQHVSAQNLVSSPGEESRIHAPGVRDQGSPQGSDSDLKRGVLGGKLGGNGHMAF